MESPEGPEGARTENVERKLKTVQEIIQYQFKDKFILWEALQFGAGVPDIWYTRFYGRPRSKHINKGLALIGDAVLRQIFACVMISDGYSPDQAQSVITESLSNSNLASVGWRHELDTLVDMGPIYVGPVGQKAVADTVEAVIGAAHQDSDHDEKIVVGVMKALGSWPPT